MTDPWRHALADVALALGDDLTFARLNDPTFASRAEDRENAAAEIGDRLETCAEGLKAETKEHADCTGHAAWAIACNEARSRAGVECEYLRAVLEEAQACLVARNPITLWPRRSGVSFSVEGTRVGRIQAFDPYDQRPPFRLGDMAESLGVALPAGVDPNAEAWVTAHHSEYPPDCGVVMTPVASTFVLVEHPTAEPQARLSADDLERYAQLARAQAVAPMLMVDSLQEAVVALVAEVRRSRSSAP